MNVCDRLKQLVKEGWKVIDVRTPSEYSAGHVAGAELVEMHEVQNLTDEGKYLVYCRSGARSGSASAYLASKGIESMNIGGINQFVGCLEY